MRTFELGLGLDSEVEYKKLGQKGLGLGLGLECKVGWEKLRPGLGLGLGSGSGSRLESMIWLEKLGFGIKKESMIGFG